MRTIKDGRRILLMVNQALVMMFPNVEYSQAATQYKLQMDENLSLKIKIDQTLRCVLERIQPFIRG